MKKFHLILAVCVMVVMAACSNSKSGGFNPETTKALIEKVQKNEEVTQEDYSEMIDQCEAAFNELNAKSDEIKDLPADKREEAALKLLEDSDYAQMYQSVLNLGMILQSHQGNLDEDNSKKLEKLMEDIEKKAKENL